LEKETLDSDEILEVVFPDGLPDYLQKQVDKAKADEPVDDIDTEVKDDFTFTGDAVKETEPAAADQVADQADESEDESSEL